VAELEDKDALRNRELVFGGIVTKSRESQTKTGKPRMIITIEDFDGNGELTLFGVDCINFGKFGRPGLFLFVRANMQPRQKWNPEEPDVFELKIKSIQLLQDVKKLVEKMYIVLPLRELNMETINELSGLIKGKTGSTALYFEVWDSENIKVELLARQLKIDVDARLISYLTEKGIEFRIN
jgi:DNA polymerase-3 subunit alpha